MDGEIGNKKLINFNNNKFDIKLNCECNIPNKMKKSSFDNLIRALNIIEEKYKTEKKLKNFKNNKKEENSYKENKMPRIISVINKKIEEIAKETKE